MEHLNRIEIRGNVGNANILRVKGTRVAHFSAATTFTSKDRNGGTVTEITWHHVMAWEGPGTAHAFRLKGGDPVHVLGRLRGRKHTGADGVERPSVEIIANEVRPAK